MTRPPYSEGDLSRRRHAAKMRRRTRRIDLFLILVTVLLLGWLLGAWFAPTAAPAATFPGERPAGNELVDQAVAIGLTYWRDRGIEPCPEPITLLADSLPADDGVDASERADLGGCRLWLTVDVVAAAQDPYTSGDPLESMCGLVAHGLGHTAGLGHDHPNTVMRDDVDVIPYACKVWARRVDRAQERGVDRAIRRHRRHLASLRAAARNERRSARLRRY